MGIKLTELINSFGSSFREVTNFIRYPFQNLSRIGMHRLQDVYEKIEVPLGKSDQTQEKPKPAVIDKTNKSLEASKEDLVLQALSKRLNTDTSPDRLKETNGKVNTPVLVKEQLVTKKSRRAEDIPILPKEREIRGGRRGRYRVESLLKDTERVRLYEGIHVLNNKSVLIKEYLLPEQDFNQKESKERKEKFEKLINLNFKNGGGQDFRLISPWDAIAPPNEKRCYLIFEPTSNSSLTLREYLVRNGCMTTQQVRQVLYQVLQTLWFLHTQSIRISSDEVQQGLPHGNLNLDSLLISINDPKLGFKKIEFFIYVSDLSIWEDLFKPPNFKIVNYSFKQDLKDLGYISFYLLSGATVDSIFGQPLDPKIEQHWPLVDDVELKKFIYRLLEIDRPFSSAFDARQALLAAQLSQAQAVPSLTPDRKQEVKNVSSWRVLLTATILGLLMGFLWQALVLSFRSLNSGTLNVQNKPAASEACCFKQVKEVPDREITYVSETDDVWNYILTKISLVSYGKYFQDELKNRDYRLSNYNQETTNNLLDDVRSGAANFAVSSYIENLPEDLEQEKVAYDALVVFVAFSDNQRQFSIPNALNGKISIEQLRELYTIKALPNWKPPKGLANQIKVYIPTDSPKTIQLFEQLVFNKKPPEQFKHLQRIISDQQQEYKNNLSYQQFLKRKNRKNDENYILGEILRDFESNQTVSFGFGLLSKVFNQCAVYPLAIGEKYREVQPLVQKVDKQIKPIDPTTNLCNDKGGYWPNVEAFSSGSYPLRYSLVVVYPKDDKRGQAGRKFAELLKTDEGQSLLMQAGLVPLRIIGNNY